MLNNRRLHLLSVILLLTLSGAVSAHNYWLKASDVGAHLFLGDAADDAPYSEDAVGKAGARAEDGRELEVTKNYDHGHMHLVAPDAHVLWTEADYGYWVKTTMGWQEGSKKDGGRIKDSARHLQYAKLLKSYNGPSKVGLPLEVVLTEVGPKTLKGVVYYQGKPAKNVPLYLGHKKVARTKSSGEFKIKRKKETLVLSALLKMELKNNENADHQILTSTLTIGSSL